MFGNFGLIGFEDVGLRSIFRCDSAVEVAKEIRDGVLDEDDGALMYRL